MRRFAIETFIEETNRAKTTQDLARLFGSALKKYGYDRFCYSLVTDHPSLGLKAGHGLASTYPEEWMEHYKTNQYEKCDPVPGHGFNLLKPFTWESLESSRNFTKEEKRVMNEAKEVRLLDGIAIPIFGPNGELAGVAMASSIGGVQPDANILSKLHALTLQFHLAYTGLVKGDIRPDAIVQLTSREREILLWAAEGKSDSIIAEIIGVTHATIRFHMKNIFKKLEANERTLATVKAIRLGLILPSQVGLIPNKA